MKLWSVSDGTLLRTVNTPEKGYLIVTVSSDLGLVGFYRVDGSFKLALSKMTNEKFELTNGKCSFPTHAACPAAYPEAHAH